MPYVIVSDIRSGVVKVSLDGRLEAQEHGQINAQVVALCRREGIARILVDVRRAEIEMSMNDLYRLAASFRNVGAPAARHTNGRPDQAASHPRLEVTIAHHRGALISEFDLPVDAAVDAAP